jgi:hypothetical protein
MTSGYAYRRVWRAKIPEKIKIFMWLLEQRVVLTKENMFKRNCHGNPDCYFVGLLSQMIICFFPVLLLRLFGVLLLAAFSKELGRQTMINIGFGLNRLCLVVSKSTCWVWLPFVGPHGKLGTKLVWRRN